MNYIAITLISTAFAALVSATMWIDYLGELMFLKEKDRALVVALIM